MVCPLTATLLTLVMTAANVDPASPSHHNNTVTCQRNQWECQGRCIHRRQACLHNEKPSCHSDFPRSCGDGERCFSDGDNCWDQACINVNCLEESVNPREQQRVTDSLSMNLELSKNLLKLSVGRDFDQRQFKFLLKCPDPEKRLEPCSQTSYGDICYYMSEWECQGKCISKSQVCDGKCHWGMKLCGRMEEGGSCVDRYTPCMGNCWHESNHRLCGNNLCLSSFQIMDHHVCNGTCHDFSVPCQGSCQSDDFFMCHSGDQCYRYWDHCDGTRQCSDGSDETFVCKLREMIVYFVPVLMTVLILTLIVIVLVLKIKRWKCNRNIGEVDEREEGDGELDEDEDDGGGQGLNRIEIDTQSNEEEEEVEETATVSTSTAKSGMSVDGKDKSMQGGSPRSLSSETPAVLKEGKKALNLGRLRERGTKKEVRVTLINLKTRSHLTVEHQQTRKKSWWRNIKDKI